MVSKRLGHVNLNDLSKFYSSELIRGILKLEKITSCVCGPRQLEKQINFPHKKVKQIITTKPLELVHIGLIGPTQIESIGGKKYIFVVVDDFSRFTWVNFIKEKLDIFLCFEPYKKCRMRRVQKLNAFTKFV